jgi:hypothetical protein
MEGAHLMGELYIQKPDGEAMTIQIDGTIVRETNPIDIDWCDKCQKWQQLSGGHYVQSQGLALIWLCEACK